MKESGRSGFPSPVEIRREQKEDFPAIRELTIEAFSASEFGHNGEADLIERIREACGDSLSLVAESEGVVVGQILFSPARIVADSHSTTGMGLGPMSVAPRFQGKGVGTQLVQAGLDLLAVQGIGWVVVLGHPEFYGRLGFEPAGRFGITCEFPGIPDEVFRIKWLSEERPDICEGVVKYRPEFSELPE